MDIQNMEMLRIFVSEQTRYGHRPLYEEIVREARLQELAGATVLKGVLSYGHDMLIKTTKIIEFSTNLPMVVEIVDHTGKIDDFLPVLERMVRDSAGRVMITRELVRAAVIE